MPSIEPAAISFIDYTISAFLGGAFVIPYVTNRIRINKSIKISLTEHLSQNP